MANRYRAFSFSEINTVMTTIAFKAVNVPGTLEHVFERRIHNVPGQPDRYTVRIYTSVDKQTGFTRDCGEDAIRVTLCDGEKDHKVLLSWSVLRTENAFENTKKRARQAWKYAITPGHQCRRCGSLMIERDGKLGRFLGCTGYPECEATRDI